MKRLMMLVALVAIMTEAHSQEYEWKHIAMDGSRTGCISPSKDNVAEALGVFERRLKAHA